MKQTRYLSILFLLLFFTSNSTNHEYANTVTPTKSPQKIAVIGTGYVGLIAGSGLAHMGHQVICSDIDEKKINMLKKGKMPIFEPGLEQIVKKNYIEQRLSFTSNVELAIQNSDVIIVAVGTPMGENGEANLAAIKGVSKKIADNLNSYKVVVIKSTVPIGTNKKIKAYLSKCVSNDITFDLVSNPEFLRAGIAIKDFFLLDPIVIGSDSEKALNIIENLYQPLIETGAELVKTNFESAEVIKYAWNSFGAIKIAYVNELSRFCSACGADIFTVIRGMSCSDNILPLRVIKPGPGIGGSCLPKDTRAFVEIGKKWGIDLSIIRGVISSNKKQKAFIIKKLYDLLNGEVKGKTIAILGLAFKANTDDIRMSPAINVIEKLLKDEAHIKAYDPKAMERMRWLFPDVTYCKSAQEVIKGADAIVLLTEWDEFKHLDLEMNYKNAKKPVIVDGRNIFDPQQLKKQGFTFANLGKAQ